MGGGLLDLVPIWTFIIGLGVFLYVLLDGFDLGVGILYGFAPQRYKKTVMNSIAPIWDGNETWLILGGGRASRRLSSGFRHHHSGRLFPHPGDAAVAGLPRRGL